MERRCAGVFVTLILLFMAMVLRIFVLSRSAYYAAVAGGQSSWLCWRWIRAGDRSMTAISSR